MKKLFVLIAACACAFALAACSGGASSAPKLSVDSDSTTVTITATNGINGQADAPITIPEGGGVLVTAEIEQGKITMTYTDDFGQVITDDVWDEGEGNAAFGVDAGELTLTVDAEDAIAEITVTAVDQEALEKALSAYDA